MSLITITPTDIPLGGNCAWEVSASEKEILLCVLSVDVDLHSQSVRVLLSNPPAGEWENIFEETRRLPDGEIDGSIPVVEMPVQIPSAPNQSIARIVSSAGVEFLHRSDGAAFALQSESSSHFESDLLVHQSVTVDGIEFGLFGNGSLTLGRRSKDSPSEGWESLDLPTPTGVISQLALWNGKLVLSVGDPVLGFGLHTAQPDGAGSLEWKSILARGADRYAANAEVFCLLPSGPTLFVACGRSGAKHAWLNGGFEILQFNEDGTWDVLVGAPRVSSSGLKVPLSARGPGFDEFNPGTLCYFCRDGFRFYLATFEPVDGLKTWTSEDGLEWTVDASGELIGCEGVRRARVLGLGERVAVILEIDHAVRGRSLHGWISAE